MNGPPRFPRGRWGGDNTNVVLYEDDDSIWKLLEPWTDFSAEPLFGASVDVCAIP